MLASADQALASAEKSALNLDRAAAAKSLAEAGKEIDGAAGQACEAPATPKAPPLAGKSGACAKRSTPRSKMTSRFRSARKPTATNWSPAKNSLVDVILAGKPAVPVKWTARQIEPGLPARLERRSRADEGKQRALRGSAVTIPADAKRTFSRPPMRCCRFRPPLVKLALPVNVEGYEFKIEKPVESSIAKTTGIETYPLELVPAVTLTVDPTAGDGAGEARLCADHSVRSRALSRHAAGESFRRVSTRPRAGACSRISRSISPPPATS